MTDYPDHHPHDPFRQHIESDAFDLSPLDADEHPFQEDRRRFKTEEERLNYMRYKGITMLREAHEDIDWGTVIGLAGRSLEEEAFFWALATYVLHVHDDIPGAGQHLLEVSVEEPLTFKKRDIVELMQRTLTFGLYYATSYFKQFQRILDEDDTLGDF